MKSELERSGWNPVGSGAVKSFLSGRILRHPAAAALLIGAMAFCLFSAGIGNPATTYYDEGFYVPAARAFLANGTYFNLSSPPLGKLLIAIGIRVAGDNPLGWRIAGLICGALTLAAVFLWTYLLSQDYRVAWTAAALTLFNNFLFVMSRVAMMDVFLVFFLFWGLLAYTAALQLDLGVTWRRLLFCAAGSLLGLAASCKWSGVDTLLVLLILSLALVLVPMRFFPEENASLARYARNLRQIGAPAFIVGLLIAPVVVYGLTFWPLCRALHLPFGIRQVAVMNLSIWHYQVVTVSNPAIASAWYTWPFKSTPQIALSYLLGNPVVMWGGLGALAFCLYRFGKYFALAEGFAAMLYSANLLQWAVTPKNQTYYYYYFPPAMFLGVAIALALYRLPRRIFGVRISLVAVVLAFAFFLWSYTRMMHLGAPWDCVFGC